MGLNDLTIHEFKNYNTILLNPMKGLNSVSSEKIQQGDSNEDRKLPIKNLLSLYPNPATICFNIFTGQGKIDEIYLFDIRGNLIKYFKDKQDNFTINTSDLITGLYLVKVNVSGSVYTGKIHIIR